MGAQYRYWLRVPERRAEELRREAAQRHLPQHGQRRRPDPLHSQLHAAAVLTARAMHIRHPGGGGVAEQEIPMYTQKTLLSLAVAFALATSHLSLHAADTADLPCRTTAECAAEAAKIGATVERVGARQGKHDDQFTWVNRINKASIVMLTEEKIVSRQQGREIARGVQHVIEQAGKPNGKKPRDVLKIERIMIDKIGPQASLVHSGRSRQDMYATYRLATLRSQLLDYTDAMNDTRMQLLELAKQHVDTLIPAYTNGVQAQPITYAHYLLAYEAAFERDAQRIRELYERLNRSPMGTAVLANSGWPLNRERLSELLGFDEVRENSLDAGQVSTYDIPIEAAGIASSSAIRIGAMLGDIHTQYHQIRPWLLLEEGSTYTSSAMPQKRSEERRVGKECRPRVWRKN